MKRFIIFTLTWLSLSAYSQTDFIHYNSLVEVEGNDYVIATHENWKKGDGIQNRSLLFIHTKTGETNIVAFSNEDQIKKVEQVKIDNLGINLILVEVLSIGSDSSKGIDMKEQIIILSPDGKQKTQLADNNFSVRSWAINKKTGTITVVGYYDTNKNGLDATDKSEIGIYDLKTLKLIKKI